jgi:hypothetical protein
MSLGVRAVASGAILLIHLLARGHVRRWKLRLIDGPPGAGNVSDQQQNTEGSQASNRHNFLQGHPAYFEDAALAGAKAFTFSRCLLLGSYFA